MLRDLVLREVLIALLMFCRIAGFLLTSPYPGEHVPRTGRVGLALSLSFFCSTIAAPPAIAIAFDLGLVLPIATELGIGLSSGFVFRLLLSAADVAGELVSQSSGLGSAQLFNPLFGAHETPMTRVYSLLGLLLMLVSGAHRVALAYLMDSFVAVPVGTPVTLSAALPQVLDLFVSSITMGVRLAMPVIAISLMVQVGLAMVARVAPSLQIFNIGFAILIGASLFTVALTMRQAAGHLSEHLGHVGQAIDELLAGLAEPR